MSPNEKRRFDRQYKKHLLALKLQGKADKTIDVYSRAVRRLVLRFNKCPDRVSRKQIEQHFSELVVSAGVKARVFAAELGWRIAGFVPAAAAREIKTRSDHRMVG